jgi:hypothetical protein
VNNGRKRLSSPFVREVSEPLDYFQNSILFMDAAAVAAATERLYPNQAIEELS